MTDRHNGLLVTFDKSIREDDLEQLINAISMIKHVIDVQPVPLDPNDMINRIQIQRELKQKLWKALEEQ